MSESDHITATKENPGIHKHLFPEWLEVVIPIGDRPDGMIKVLRTGSILRYQLRNSSALTWFNFTLALNVPSYNPDAFTKSFSYATLDEESWIDIEILPNGLDLTETCDVLFVYLAVVFWSYIKNGDGMEMRALSIAMALKETGVFHHTNIKRYLEICWLNGKGFREFRGTQRTVLTESRRVQDTLTLQPRGMTEEWSIRITPPKIAHWVNWLTQDIWREIPPKAKAVVAYWATQVENIVTPRLNPSMVLPADQWMNSFIRSIEDKPPTRAIKLIERAIIEKRFGEAWNNRLRSILETRRGMTQWEVDITSNTLPNPNDFIDWLSWSLGDQVDLLEKQLKRWKRYGEAYIAGLQKHKELLEVRLTRK